MTNSACRSRSPKSFVGAGPGEGPAPTGINAEFDFATDLFDPAAIEGLRRPIRPVADEVTIDPATGVAALPLSAEATCDDLTPRSGVPVYVRSMPGAGGWATGRSVVPGI